MNEFGPKPGGEFIVQNALLEKDLQLKLNQLRAAQLQRELSDDERQRLIELQQDENMALEGRKSETMRKRDAA